MLDMAFEEEGFCVVRGPDLLWGGDVFDFHPPSGVFAGVIGGPPCKGDSQLAHMQGEVGTHLRDEFQRIVYEAVPDWWVMEAVKRVEDLMTDMEPLPMNNRWLGQEQSRKRWFHSNLNLRRYAQFELFENIDYSYAVRAANRTSAKGTTRKGMGSYTIREMLRLQGLPAGFLSQSPFTVRGKEEVIGNGVPLPMGRAVARAVIRATGGEVDGTELA